MNKSVVSNETASNGTANTAGYGSQSSCGWPEDPEVDLENAFLYLDSTTYPILLILSTLGNIVNILVLGRERPRTSKNIYLVTLAYADMCYMWTQFIPYVKSVSAEDALSEGFIVFTRSTSGIWIFLQETAAFVADWTVIAFSVDRFLAIKSPLQHMLISSAARSMLIAGVIVTLASILASCGLIDIFWFRANDLGVPHPLPVRPVSLKRLKVFYSWTLTVVPVATFFVVLFLNSCLILTLAKKLKTRTLRFQSSVTSETKTSNGAQRSASLMLAACVLLYLVTQTLPTVLNVFESLDAVCIRHFSREAKAWTDPLKMFLQNMNYSLNFVAYCAVNPAFRAALPQLFRRTFRADQRASTTSRKTLTSHVAGSVHCPHQRTSLLRGASPLPTCEPVVDATKL